MSERRRGIVPSVIREESFEAIEVRPTDPADLDLLIKTVKEVADRLKAYSANSGMTGPGQDGDKLLAALKPRGDDDG